MQSARARGDIAPDLGNPLGRRPHAAVLNFVKFHTDVVASLAYHLVKLNHNVTVFVRDDELGMDDVIHPFHWKGFKRWQRFFDHFYEFDVVVLATYPTCHLGTLQALVATGLPQRYIAMVHNPTLLAADGAAAARAAAAGGVQLLTIAPHVNAYANEILQDVGWEQEDARWLAPAFPVLFPEQCSSQLLRSPSGMAAQQPACNRSALWTDAMEPRAAASARASPLTAAPATSKPDTGSTGGSGSRRDGHTKAKEKPASSSSSSRAAPQREPSSRPPARPAPPAALHQRRGFCIQGKLDPARRGYAALFAEMVARRKELLATDLVLVLQGKGGGRFDADILEVPDQLEEEGLVIKFAALPFQVGTKGGCSLLCLPACLLRGGWVGGGGHSSVQGGHPLHGNATMVIPHGATLTCSSPPFRRSTTSSCAPAWVSWPPLPPSPTSSTRAPPQWRPPS